MDPSGTNDSNRLNQASAHDTGIYDPDLHDNQIVAMYDTDQQARAAHDMLVSSGVSATTLQLVSKGAETGTLGGVNAEDRDAGVWGTIRNLFAPDDDRNDYSHAVGRGHAILLVNPTHDMDRQKLVRMLESTEPVDFDARLEEWRQSGYDTSEGHPDYRMTTARADATPAGTTSPTGMPPAGMSPANTATQGAVAPGAMPRTAPGTTTSENDTLKVVQEQLRVGKRMVESGAVRIRSYIVERPVEEQVRLREERVRVERTPVDRAATPADMAAFQERTIEARATSEEAVVSKEARVIEEVGLRKDATERTETVHDTVRETKVDVEDGLGTAASKGAGTLGTNTPGR